MNIRPITPEDSDAVAALVNASYSGFDPEFRMVGRRVQTGERIHAAIVQRGERGVVAETDDGGQLLGVSLWRPYGDPVAVSHLHLLFVHPDQNRKGLGGELISRHWEQSKADWPEVGIFTLNVLKGSYWALPFYAKQGYRIYQEGDEGSVPNLGAYFRGPHPPGRQPPEPYFILHYLPAQDVPAKAG